MTKISTSNKSLTDLHEKYCKIILTESKSGVHRFVEKADGSLEYQIGEGNRKSITARSFRTTVKSIVQAAKSHQLEFIALHIDFVKYKELEKMGEIWFYRTLAENLQLAQYEFTKYKTKEDESPKLKEILVCGIDTKTRKDAFFAGLTIGESANITRDIANTTGDHMTPSKLASATKSVLKGTGVAVRVLDRKAIKQQKMGLLEEVGKGASDGPCLIIMEYWGAGKPTKNSTQKNPIILVGKGITYDTGGLNVKPSGSMHEMHMDMSGGAAMIGTMRAISKLDVKRNVVALIPAAENSISAECMRAGDIATSMSGKTVEILHTDAEGRLVLADALTYAQKHYSPRVMIDVATLTGAALVALGQQTSALMTTNKKLSEILTTLGEETGDLVWPLPLWDEYKQSLKSSRADIANIATNFSRFGGCIEGGTFLSFFVSKKIPWAHIDIAPRMDSISSDKLAKGATGEPVRLLVKFIEEY